jgi:hypothetical protein
MNIVDYSLLVGIHQIFTVEKGQPMTVLNNVRKTTIKSSIQLYETWDEI